MYWTNYGENAYADKMRGTEPTLPSNWYLAFGTLADDGSFTEIVHASMPRIVNARTLAAWAGTQGAGTTLASSGTSHVTSNNTALTWAAPSADLGTAKFIGRFDSLTGGHCWDYVPIADLPILTGVAPSLAIGSVSYQMGGSGMSDYLSNKLIDEYFRGQLYPWPASQWLALYTVAPTSAGGGTEVGGGVGYLRKELQSTMAALSGTQSAGSTSASSGSAGRISNNATLAYPAPSGAWGSIVAEGSKDTSSGGNLLWWGPIPAQSILGSTPAPSHAPNTLGLSLTKH